MLIAVLEGLPVHPNPLPELRSTLESTIQSLSSIPESSVYRQATIAITKHKLCILERASGDVSIVEQEIDQGQIEEVLEAAKDELALAVKMVEWKACVALSCRSILARNLFVFAQMGAVAGASRLWTVGILWQDVITLMLYLWAPLGGCNNRHPPRPSFELISVGTT